MRKYQLKVHRLEELDAAEARRKASETFAGAPGKVVIRGSNRLTSQGNIIKVRLFYDDEDLRTITGGSQHQSTMSPRRSYNDMMETLIHELAHQRHEKHDEAWRGFFRELCEQYNNTPGKKATIPIVPREKKKYGKDKPRRSFRSPYQDTSRSQRSSITQQDHGVLGDLLALQDDAPVPFVWVVK